MTNCLILKTDSMRLLLRASVAMIGSSVNGVDSGKSGEMLGLLAWRGASAISSVLMGRRKARRRCGTGSRAGDVNLRWAGSRVR